MAVLIVYFFLYESSNLTLEQVEEMYNDPSVRAWNSSSMFSIFSHNLPYPRRTVLIVSRMATSRRSQQDRH